MNADGIFEQRYAILHGEEVPDAANRASLEMNNAPRARANIWREKGSDPEQPPWVSRSETASAPMNRGGGGKAQQMYRSNSIQRRWDLNSIPRTDSPGETTNFRRIPVSNRLF